eukprot:jgi/Botrbrau1/11513/Bobra.0198s0010.1
MRQELNLDLIRMKRTQNVDVDLKDLASALLSLGDVDALPQICTDGFENIFGCGSLIYCRVAATMRPYGRHIYVITCGNIVLNDFNIGLIKCPPRLVASVSGADYWIDTCMPSSPARTLSSKLHGASKTLTVEEGAFGIVSVPIMGACEDGSEKAVHGFLTCAWRLENPMLAQNFIPGMQSLAAEMSSTFAMRMKPLVDDVQEHFLGTSVPLPATGIETTRMTPQPETSCKENDDSGRNDPRDPFPPSATAATSKPAALDAQSLASLPSEILAEGGLSLTAALITQQIARSCEAEREAGTLGRTDEPGLGDKSGSKNAGIQHCLSKRDLSIEPNCHSKAPPSVVPNQATASSASTGSAAMHPIRLTFLDSALERLFMLNLAARQITTDLGWALFFIITILMIGDRDVLSLALMRAVLLLHASLILCIVLVPDWYRRRREVLCLWTYCGTRALISLGWICLMSSENFRASLADRVARHMLLVIPFVQGADYLGYKVRFWPGLLRPFASVFSLVTGAHLAMRAWGWSLLHALLLYSIPYAMAHVVMTVLLRKWEVADRLKFFAALQHVPA